MQAFRLAGLSHGRRQSHWAKPEQKYKLETKRHYAARVHRESQWRVAERAPPLHRVSLTPEQQQHRVIHAARPIAFISFSRGIFSSSCLFLAAWRRGPYGTGISSDWSRTCYTIAYGQPAAIGPAQPRRQAPNGSPPRATLRAMHCMRCTRSPSSRSSRIIGAAIPYKFILAMLSVVISPGIARNRSRSRSHPQVRV